MTSLSTSANSPTALRQDTAVRSVPWRRLAWVAWRQYRAALYGAVALLGALAVYLLIMGLKIRSAYAGVAACHPASSVACQDLSSNFNNTYWATAEVVAGVLLVIPVLIGVFAGAPILARELDSGTFRFAWTQGAGRIRWTVARLALPAVAVTAATAALSLLFGWYYWPFFAEGQDSRLDPHIFNLTGLAFAAWTLAAFAIGALAGVLIRRVVPAIAAAMAAWAGLLLATVLFLRQHYMTPLTTSNPNIGPPAWALRSWWTGPNGKPASQAAIDQLLQRAPVGPPKKIGPNSFSIKIDPYQVLTQHGYTQWTSYQPGNRFWPFQLIEGGWLLALSLLLLAATVWLVRRRPA